MRAVVISEPGRVELTDVPDPAPGPRDVVVAVSAVGICGTDLHILDGDAGRLPVVPGHEIAGEVVAAGRDVDSVAVGDRVVVDPNLPCLVCRPCRRGRTNLCENLEALGVTRSGGAAEYVAAPDVSCIRVPDSLDLHHAALAEPLSCAVRAYDVLGGRLDSTVLIVGAGAMGLMLQQLASRCGAVATDVVERDPVRRARAARLGCDRVAASIEDLGREARWDVVVDASGNVNAIQTAIGHVARGGVFLQVGVAPTSARVEVSPYTIYREEITIAGSMAVLHSLDRALDLIAAGVIDPAEFITDTLPLDGYEAALASFARSEGLKTLVVPGLAPG